MKFSRKFKTINDMYQMYKDGKLILQPFFQRNLVWTEKAKSRFIESILLNIPIAEMYLYEEKDNRLSVIDGQQRLSTIFNFIDKKFTLKDLEKVKEIENENIDFKYKKDFLAFSIHYVVIDSKTAKEDIIDMYSRINEYTVNLNQQELRRAAYSDSDFLKLSEELAQLEFFGHGRFFTPRKRQRMNDVEFISELLALQLDSIQDKKSSLDSFYLKYSKFDNLDLIETTFKRIIENIQKLFKYEIYFVDDKSKYDGKNSAKNIGLTRFKQQADFYSLFNLFKELDKNKVFLDVNQEEKILKIFLLLDYLIEPESYIDILSTYAIKCVSQGNTKNSREFRFKLLSQVVDFVISESENELISMLKEDFNEIFELEMNFLDFDLSKVKEKINEIYDNLED